MKTLKIGSVESLEVAVAECVRQKVEYTKAMAGRDAAVAAVQKEHQVGLTKRAEDITRLSDMIFEFCVAHRAELFVGKKSRGTDLAEFGFELTPFRVETATRKIRWKDVVERLKRLSWAGIYVRQPEPVPDKQAMLADRESLTPEQCKAMGIEFCQDEQFFIRPLLETAGETVKEAA